MANQKFSQLDTSAALTGVEILALAQSGVSKKSTLTAIKNFLDAATATLLNKTLTTPVINSPTGIVKGDVGLGNVDNTSDANKPVSTAQAAADTATLASAQAYAEGLVVGLWDDRGNYDASVNTFPAAGGSGTAGAVLKGDIWTVSVAGTVGGVAVATRQTLRATIDTPGQTLGNWAIGLANTDLDDAITDGVTGRAPSQNAVFDALAGKAAINNVAVDTHAATSKATPVDADEIPLADSAASFVLKRLTWANLKATLLAWLQATVFPAPGAIGGTTPAAVTTTLLTATAASAGATVEVVKAVNTGSGANTKARFAFWAAGANYVSLNGGYGASAPEMSIDINGVQTMVVLGTGISVPGALVTGANGLGYGTGSGGAVTQATSRTTGVTLNKTNGSITLVSAAGSASWQSFTVTNSTVAATDTVKVSQKSGTDLNMIHVTAVAAGSFRISFATTGGTTTEQPVFNFAVIKAVAA
jgi:hypothetical protein